MEPARPFVRGWAIDAICEHLEAVALGALEHSGRPWPKDRTAANPYPYINRLLENVPPGFLKSLATDVFLPAWIWGPLGWPSARFLAFSYSSGLTERDNQRFGAIVSSDKYQSLWGHAVTLPHHDLGKQKVMNLQTGWKIASSVGGVGTGERADFVICFPAWEMVATEIGPIRIGDIVDGRVQVRAWSLNQATGEMELKRIIGWHKNPGRQLVRIIADDGSTVTCTEDHRILTPDGYREAGLFRPGDEIFTAPRGMFRASPAVILAQGQIQMCPDPAPADCGNCASAHAKFERQHRSRIRMALGDLAHHVFGQMRRAVPERPMRLAIGYILRARAIMQIGQARIGAIAVLVANFLPRWAWANESFGDQLVAEAEIGFSPRPQRDARIASAQNRGEYLFGPGHGVAAAHDNAGHAFDATAAGNQIGPIKAVDLAPVLRRVIHVEPIHEVPPATYCITVDGNHNLVCGSGAMIICSNCDDPHNVKESESEPIRQETIRWFRESITSRMNSAVSSAIIVIMQRVHEEDVSGVILEEMEDYCHLLIPMEYDWDRGATAIGWTDPRSEEGELAFPERFPAEAVARDKNAMGPSATASQFQQSPSPRSGNIIERDWWKLWPPSPDDPDFQGKNFDPRAFPPCSLIIGSVDTAYGQKDDNAYNAMTVLGQWEDARQRPKIVLMEAWRARLPLRGVMPADAVTDEERRPYWGLVEKVLDTIRRRNLDIVLIENKTRGGDLAAELGRLLRRGECQVVMIEPRGDKVARLHAVQSLFADGMIYAPDRVWAEAVINECMIAGTKIITKLGVKNIEDIQPGDEVLTHFGRFRPVLRTSCREAEETVTICGKSVDPITMTGNHPLFAAALDQQRTVEELGWVPADMIEARKYRPVIRDGIARHEAWPSGCHAISLPIPVRENPIEEIDLRDWVSIAPGKRHELLWDNERVTTRHPAIKEIIWRQPLDERFGRIIGLYLAEGSGQRAGYSWSVNAKTEQHLVEEVASFAIERLGVQSHRRTQNNCTTVTISLPLLEEFFLGCGKHAHNKRIPEWCWNAPDAFVKGLIEAYAEGDGYINHEDIQICTTVSPSLAWGIRILALRLGIEATVTTKKESVAVFKGREYKTRRVYRMSWRNKAGHAGATLMHEGYALMSVMKVDRTPGPVTVYNMDVMEDHSYCTTGGLVHNCSAFPKGKYADFVDTVSQGLSWLRNSGSLLLGVEADSENLANNTFRSRQRPRYDV